MEAKDLAGQPTKMVLDFEWVRRIGGRNLRDLGGHPTQDGRIVRRDRIYRSAHLAMVPEASPVRRLKLRTLVTLQSQVEVSTVGPPDPKLFDSVQWRHIPMGDKWFREGAFTEITKTPGNEHLVLVTDFKDAWGKFFTMLAEPQLYPMLFHCSAGRDRTGVGAVMLLELLGVSRDLVLADFLASNTTFHRAPLQPEQIQPVFDLIDSHGGIECFMKAELGVAPTSLEVIRHELTERKAG